MLTSQDYLLNTGSTHTILRVEAECVDVKECARDENLICETNTGEIIFKKKGNLKLFNIEFFINALYTANIVTFH